MEHLLAGEPAAQAWESACDDVARKGQDPRLLPGARRASIRFERHSSTLLELSESYDREDIFVEEELLSEDGELTGTPDLVLRQAGSLVVVDHKTSIVADAGVPKPHYERQLRIYAGLAADHYGVPTSRGVLLSTRQGAVDVDVSPAAVADALARARSLRAAYNERVPATQPAIPSVEACQWCPYRARCDGFWNAVQPSWSAELGECAKVRILGEPEVAANGLAAVMVASDSGPDSQGEHLTIAGIPRELISGAHDGDSLALTGLRRRDEATSVLRWTERSSLHVRQVEDSV